MHVTGRQVIGAVLLVLAVLGGVKLSVHAASHGSSPVACQVHDGVWTMWSGWLC